ARLIEAVHSITEQHDKVFYFPAYELLIDVLRDYRFYKSDMVHANDIAVTYVFETFCNTYLDEATKKLITEIKALQNAMNHKPFQSETASHKTFLKTQFERAQKIIGANPEIDLSKEINYFSGIG
ncbi:MAG: GSCFA domain-containing protein, partial [Ginsengibacter sp.]